MSYRKILLCVDNSEHSDHAAGQTGFIAQKLGSAVVAAGTCAVAPRSGTGASSPSRELCSYGPRDYNLWGAFVLVLALLRCIRTAAGVLHPAYTKANTSGYC